jgi:hypothetical protein
VFAAWCLGFAAVNAWQLATGRLPDDEFGDYTTVLTVMSVAGVPGTGAARTAPPPPRRCDTGGTPTCATDSATLMTTRHRPKSNARHIDGRRCQLCRTAVVHPHCRRTAGRRAQFADEG